MQASRRNARLPFPAMQRFMSPAYNASPGYLLRYSCMPLTVPLDFADAVLVLAVLCAARSR